MSADVHNMQRLVELRAHLLIFGQMAKEALASVTLEVRRLEAWLEEQLGSWQIEVRRAEDAVFQARLELQRRQMMIIGDRKPDTAEQEKQLRRAQLRLEFAQEKRDRTKEWIRQLPDVVRDYQGRSRPLQDWLEIDLPRMSALLDRKVQTLEEYARLAPPEGNTP